MEDIEDTTIELSEDELFDSKTEHEIEMYLSNDVLSDFLRMLRKYPPATKEENYILAKRIKAGDESAREELINRNIRLVISTVMHYSQKLKSYEKIDLIQDGLVALLRAADTYDETKQAFSTYAVTCIQHMLSYSFNFNNEMIRVPVDAKRILRDYFKIKADNPKMSIEEIAEALHMSKRKLLALIENSSTPLSMDAPVNDEEDDSKVGDFIKDDKNEYDNILEKDNDKEMLLFFKNHLSKTDYYIFYYRFIDIVTLQSISEKIGVSRQRTLQMENHIKDKVKRYYLKSGERKSSLKLDLEDKKHIDELKIEPVEPDRIVRYLYLKEVLTLEERRVYQEIIGSKYIFGSKQFLKSLDISLEELNSITSSIEEKEKTYIDDSIDAYNEFKKELLRDYKTGIFKIELDREIDLKKYTLSTGYTYNIWKNRTYEEFLEYLSSQGEEIPLDLIDKVKSFFNVPIETEYIHKSRLEDILNTYIYGFDHKLDLPNNVLHKTLLKYKDSFSKRDFDILLFKLGYMSFKDLKSTYPDIEKKPTAGYLMIKLYRLHFSLQSYKQYGFTREKYLSIRDKCVEKMDREYVELLDEFYKNEGDTTPHKELAKKYNMDLMDIKYKIRKAKLQAVDIYIGKSSTMKMDLDIYENYLLWHDIDFTDPTKTIVEECIMLRHDYETVAKKLNMSTLQVSNCLTTAMWKIDSYRFGVFMEEVPYTLEFMRSVLKNTKSFTDTEKEILEYYIQEKVYDKTIEKFNMTGRNKLCGMVSKFYTLCRIEATKDVELSIEEIKNEIETYDLDSVLTELEKKYLALRYGIKCKYYSDSVPLTKKEIKERLALTTNQVFILENYTMPKIKAKKIGLLRKELAFVDRKEMEELLLDPHVPISDKEYDLLIHIYGLYGNEILPLESFIDKYGESKKSLLRRIQRAYIMTKRYQNGEIEGKVDFKTDVEPYLKYFSYSDRVYLIEYYKNGLVAKDIAKKLGVSINIAYGNLFRLRIYLEDIKNKGIRTLDFDYFYSVVENKDLPYIGDKKRALEFFKLYYEDKLGVPDIVKLYGDPLTANIVRIMINDLEIAVLKYKEGIRLTKSYTYEEVRSYYLSHHTSMSTSHKLRYYTYFQSRENGYSLGTVPTTIALDLIREDKDCIHLDIEHKDVILECIKNNSHKFTSRQIREISRRIGIKPRDTMSGHEITQVLNFISSLRYRQAKTLTLKRPID